MDSLGLQLSNYAARCWFGCRCRQGCWRRRRRPAKQCFENETRDPIPLPSSIEHRSRVDFGGDGLHASALVGLRRLVDRAVHLAHLRPLHKQRPESTHLAPLPLRQHSTRKCGVSRAQCANRAAVLPARAESACGPASCSPRATCPSSRAPSQTLPAARPASHSESSSSPPASANPNET